MAGDGLRQKAIVSVGWVIADKWGGRLSNLAVLVILGRLLDPSDFGLVAFATAYLAIVGVFADQGFAKALIQRGILGSRDASTAFWSSLSISLAIVGLTFWLGPYFSLMVGEPGLTPVLQAMSAVLVMNAISSIPAALLERELSFKALAVRRLSGTFIGSIAAVTAAFMGAGVWSLVVQNVGGASVSMLVLLATSRWRPAFQFSFFSLKSLWAFGMGIFLSELIHQVNSQTDRVVIGIFFSPEVLGYYYLATQIVAVMVDLFASVLSALSLSAFSRLQTDRARMLDWLYRMVRLSSTVATPSFAVAAVAAPVLVPTIFGEQWTAAVPIMQVLCLLGVINAVAYFDKNALLAAGRPYAVFLLTAGQAVLGTALLFGSISFGVLGVAVSVVLRQYIYWPVRLFMLHKYVGVSPRIYLTRWAGPLALASLYCAVVFAATAIWPSIFEHPVLFLAGVSISALVYFSLGTRFLLPSAWKDLRHVVTLRFKGRRMETE